MMIRIKILLVIIFLASALIFITPIIVAPILCNKIAKELNEKYTDYIFKIDKVHLSLIPSELKLNMITIYSKAGYAGDSDLTGKIVSIQIVGIKFINAIFKNKYDIDKIIISNSLVEGKVPLQANEKPQTVFPLNIHIENLLFDHINISLKDTTSAQMFLVKNGILEIVDVNIAKHDTIGVFKRFDFESEQFLSVSADSLYTYKARDIIYSDSLKSLSIDGLYITPNYNEDAFTERLQYQTDRIEAVLSHVSCSHFHVEDYFQSGNLVISYIDIGNVDLNIFRDKRKKESNHARPAFQNLIYNYPGLLRIDSIGFKNGNITYIEHAKKANESGRVSLNKLKSTIYNITNDTIFKTKDASMEMMAEALLMGKSKMTVSLKAKLFDKSNTFSMTGTLAEIDIKELNPILEKNASIFANSGNINKMNFNFTANDTKATGQMIMLYKGLDLGINNKQSNESKTLKARIITFIANEGVWNSNPTPGDEVRVGIIDFKNDPSKFIVNYCVKSIISGIKSSIIKVPMKKKKNFLQKIFSRGQGKQKNANKIDEMSIPFNHFGKAEENMTG